jgi:hypothetical protein
VETQAGGRAAPSRRSAIKAKSQRDRLTFLLALLTYNRINWPEMELPMRQHSQFPARSLFNGEGGFVSANPSCGLYQTGA